MISCSVHNRMKYTMLPLLVAALVAVAACQAPPTNVRGSTPKYVVEDHCPFARTNFTWQHPGPKPRSFRFEGQMPGGDVTVQESITSTNTTIDLNYFTPYNVTIKAVYAYPNGTEYYMASKPIHFYTGECAPPEIVWYDFDATATSVALKWLPTTSLYFNFTTGYNLTLVPNRDGQRPLNFVTPQTLNYTAHGLTPSTTYTTHIYPFYRYRNGTVLRPNETVFKFNTLHQTTTLFRL